MVECQNLFFYCRAQRVLDATVALLRRLVNVRSMTALLILAVIASPLPAFAEDAEVQLRAVCKARAADAEPLSLPRPTTVNRCGDEPPVAEITTLLRFFGQARHWAAQPVLCPKVASQRSLDDGPPRAFVPGAGSRNRGPTAEHDGAPFR